MTTEVAVIGDIHGNSAALTGMLDLLGEWPGMLVVKSRDVVYDVVV
jgi:hypothetical protein